MRDSLKVILVIQLAMYVAIALDVPIARQIIGFVFLSFVPGTLLLRILRLNVKSVVKNILLSAGLSIAFLMFIGLLINDLYPLIGVSNPLSTLPLTITIAIVTQILWILGYWRDRNSSSSKSTSVNVNFLPQTMLLCCLPFLSILGTVWVDNSILLALIVVISALVTLTVFSQRLIPPELYSLELFVIAVALSFHIALMSKYLIGYDVHLEYYVLELTKASFRWNPLMPFSSVVAWIYNSMLSITILPTIYSILLNMESVWVFKIIYSLIYSLIPVTLYNIYHKQIGKMAAFLSTFFFMAGYIFYSPEMLSLMRQTIAGLFFALLIFLVVDKEMDPLKRKGLFIIFSGALIMSHYALSYILIFYMFLTLLLVFFIKDTAVKPHKTLSMVLALLFFTLAFTWYIYGSGSPFAAIMNTISDVGNNFLLDFLKLGTRGNEMTMYLNLPFENVSILHRIGRILFYTPQILIIVGTIRLMIKREKTFDAEYALMSMVSLVLLFICVTVPNLSPYFGLTRIYYITLFFLAPFCILGGETIFHYVSNLEKTRFLPSRSLTRFTSKNNIHRFIALVLIAYFLFQVGFIYEITNDEPNSISLSWQSMKESSNIGTKVSYYLEYTQEQDVFSAKWLSRNIGNTSVVYSDNIAKEKVLTSYGLIPWHRMYELSNSTTLGENTYIYLRYLNVIEGMITKRPLTAPPWSVALISPLLNKSNTVYTNGYSEIYRSRGD